MTSVIIDWAISIPGKATALLSLGLFAVWMARRSRASVRHLLLAATFGALIALPAGIAAFPAIGVPVPERPGRAAASAAVHSVAIPTVGKTETAVAASPSWELPSISTLAQGIWIAGASILLLALGRDMWRLRQLRRSALPATRLRGLVQTLAAGQGIRRPVDVLMHEEVPAPLTCGTWNPAIVLPCDAIDWNEADLRRAVIHELEHVRRGDWAVQLAVRAVCACYWFHPLVWVTWRRLGLEAERACDDAVVGGSVHADYAEQLVTLAQRLSRQAQPALGMAKRSDLSARVSSLLDRTQRRGRAGLPAAAMAVAAVCVAIGTIAPVTAVAQSNKPSRSVRAMDRALLEAADEGDIDGMRELLNAGANVNARVSGDGTALLVAAREGRMAAVQLLLARGADVNLGVEGDGNPLIMAAREGHFEIVRLLLDKGANVDQVVDGDENALIQASGAGHLDVVRLLVDRGANVNARVFADNREWRSPLSMARRNNRTNVVEYLMEKGSRD